MIRSVPVQKDYSLDDQSVVGLPETSRTRNGSGRARECGHTCIPNLLIVRSHLGLRSMRASFHGASGVPAVEVGIVRAHQVR